MKSNADEIYQALSRPWPPGAVKQRKGPGNKMLSYVDARQVQNRLDEVVGSGNWQTHFTEVCGNYCCTLAIKIDGEWVAKSDGAGGTSIEGEKGGFSDAFKRAAVSFGVARYLYTDASLTPEQFDEAASRKSGPTEASLTSKQNDEAAARKSGPTEADILTGNDLVGAIKADNRERVNQIWEAVIKDNLTMQRIWQLLGEESRQYLKNLRGSVEESK